MLWQGKARPERWSSECSTEFGGVGLAPRMAFTADRAQNFEECFALCWRGVEQHCVFSCHFLPEREPFWRSLHYLPLKFCSGLWFCYRTLKQRWEVCVSSWLVQVFELALGIPLACTSQTKMKKTAVCIELFMLFVVCLLTLHSVPAGSWPTDWLTDQLHLKWSFATWGCFGTWIWFAFCDCLIIVTSPLQWRIDKMLNW